MFTFKIDEDISLKLPEAADADRVFELTDNSRNHLREWLGWVDMTKRVEDTKAFIQIARKGYIENKSLTTFILYKGEIAGTAGYNEIDWTNKVAYIGYWLGEGYQGNGIMTRVAKALTDYAFMELNLNRVDIKAAYENKKSRAVPERLGFVEEGRIRQAEWLYDHYVDHIVYGMLKEEWKR
ncbi:ribosomal-protein-serine acetyltransferase [Thalassobacillus devorans]|uniref:Ribosomal-protein-serine acetyltransferase n=1 Tax=Thalassobacillus devorans TaxID=279813 RepID=A0ABQ1PEW8_9BACI|nr:GNAT family protein [Thalassobacillus devorans]NIK29329.1 ribosomal-protein-serine acetyltransferase [Thalassobacillus devorans]GGC95827.1 ribosomal-protein-serine acetyltransferase [Thalassobacillus devorans]